MTTSDFLLELLSEEIPARMQAGARNDLARLFAEELEKAGLSSEAIDVFSTPRRLALIARAVPLETEARSEEIKGPRTSATQQALDGFLRKTGLKREQLEDRDGIYYARVETAGQRTLDLLGPMVERIVRAFPWPKSMRWGEASASTASLRWVRPLHGIVAMLGEEIVPVSIDGIASGATTFGHRFHHPGPITIGGASDYAEKLKACHVIVDQDEREAIIRDGAARIAKEAGLELVADEGLVVENAGLTEWPVPLLGRFEADYLDVPSEVIVLTMRANQKYFACTVPPPQGEGDRAKHGGGVARRGTTPPPSAPGSSPGSDTSPSGGGLAPAFVCVANIDATDGGDSIVEGNRRVLAARLADARHFWEEDSWHLEMTDDGHRMRLEPKRLEERLNTLNQIVFHEKLGTVADKVERVAMLAEWLAADKIVPNCDPKLVRRAAQLAKADLVTGMVGEFPELQGVIGGYLAEAQGEPKVVADAVRDHYKPVGQGDEVPTAPVTVAVSLADKLDSLFMFTAAHERATGSKDPLALRRIALSAIRIIDASNLRLSMHLAFEKIYRAFAQPSQRRDLWSDAAEAAELNVQPIWYEEVEGISNRKEQDFFVYYPVDFDNERWREFELGFLEPSYSKKFGVPVDDDLEGVYWNIQPFTKAAADLLDFFADRLKVQQREAGVRHDLIDAVFALGGEDDLVRLLARVRALQDFVETEEGADLLTAYKRAANILKKEKWESGKRDSRLRGNDEMEAEEAALVKALDEAEPKATAAVEAEDFTAAMAALASLRKPIDDFFDRVTVNDPDKAKRARRLDLLMRFRDAVHRVADFSKIEG